MLKLSGSISSALSVFKVRIKKTDNPMRNFVLALTMRRIIAHFRDQVPTETRDWVPSVFTLGLEILSPISALERLLALRANKSSREPMFIGPGVIWKEFRFHRHGAI